MSLEDKLAKWGKSKPIGKGETKKPALEVKHPEPKKTVSPVNKSDPITEQIKMLPDNMLNKELVEAAIRSGYVDKVLKVKDKAMKIHEKELILKLKSKELIEREFVEFLFFGYLDKCNLDFLGMTKRLTPMIENYVKADDTPGLIKFLNKEISKILKSIQKQQDKDAEEWKKEK